MFFCKYNSVAMAGSTDISPHFFCKICAKYSKKSAAVTCQTYTKTRPAFRFIKRSKKSGFKTQFIGTRSGSGGAESLPPDRVRSVFLGLCQCLAVAAGWSSKRKPLRSLDEVGLCSLGERAGRVPTVVRRRTRVQDEGAEGLRVKGGGWSAGRKNASAFNGLIIH